MTRLLPAVAPALGSLGVGLLARTLRIRREERTVEGFWKAGAPVIYAAWHSQILLLGYLYRHLHARVLVSRSRDGELIARLLARFGIETVRGSSSRDGAEALRALARSVRDGWDVFVVPDGPRGPRETVKPGIVTLARLTGAPIVPGSVGASPAWRLRSWDEFRVPKPFARCVIRFGEPIRVARGADPEAEEAARRELEAALRALTRRAEEEALS